MVDLQHVQEKIWQIWNSFRVNSGMPGDIIETSAPTKCRICPTSGTDVTPQQGNYWVRRRVALQVERYI